MPEDGRAKQIMNYSFLVAFANDGTLDKGEVEFMEKLALKDGVVDEDEKEVFRKIFARVDMDSIADDTRLEIESFRAEHSI